MKEDKTRFTADRRLFLKGFAVAGGTAALSAVAATGLVDHANAEDTVAGVPEKPASRGYHETRHIRDYYRVLRS